MVVIEFIWLKQPFSNAKVDKKNDIYKLFLKKMNERSKI